MKLNRMKDRADSVWGAESQLKGALSDLLGSSACDIEGQTYWKVAFRTSFIAPHFYIETETPLYDAALNALRLGEDQFDRPLYYFIDSGAYAISTDSGLLFVAGSTEQFFESFISFAEWIDVIIACYGNEAFEQGDFKIEDVKSLKRVFLKLLPDRFEGSFWAFEIEIISSRILQVDL